MTLRRAVPLFTLPMLLAIPITACSDDKAADTSSSVPSPSTTSISDSAVGAGTDSPFGGGHKPPVAHVADIAKLGAGPNVGDEWTAAIGLNVCGRFLDPPVGPTTGAVTPNANGTVTIAPTSDQDSGHAANLSEYARSVGITLETGRLKLPKDVTPPEIELGESTINLAGQMFADGFDCNGVPASVEAWVYSPEAVQTGDGLVTVVEDPQEVPFAADGMAVVITLMPDSSLPTLPPSAAALR